MSMKTVKLTYFKASGKYYTEGIYQANEPCYDFDIYDLIANWSSRVITHNLPLPGLCGNEWEGDILVEIENGVPCIIHPKIRIDFK